MGVQLIEPQPFESAKQSQVELHAAHRWRCVVVRTLLPDPVAVQPAAPDAAAPCLSGRRTCFGPQHPRCRPLPSVTLLLASDSPRPAITLCRQPVSLLQGLLPLTRHALTRVLPDQRHAAA